jgi:S1-C subfamily serine protease
MEELNKNQLILLTLLVSFVTSIATGIITVSLLQEAPPSVTQVINRVVEKTIEQAITTTTGESGKETVREVTVVVKEDDRVIEAISKNSKSILRITDNALVDGVKQFYGIGFLITKDGLVIAAARDIANPASTYTGVFADGKSFTLKFVGKDESGKVGFFRILTGNGNPAIVASPATISTASPVLGQSVITFDGEERNTAITGRITALDTSTGGEVNLIRTDISGGQKVVGSPLVNLSGEVVGIRIGSESGSHAFVPALPLRKELAKFPSN